MALLKKVFAGSGDAGPLDGFLSGGPQIGNQVESSAPPLLKQLSERCSQGGDGVELVLPGPPPR